MDGHDVDDDEDIGAFMDNGKSGESFREVEIREQDRYLPVANIARIMKKVLPGNAKIAKDSKENIQECVSEFISFITSEASDKCQQEKRKTINGDDLLWAMSTLGFEKYVDPLKLYLSKYRESVKGEKPEKKSSSKKDTVQICPPQHKFTPPIPVPNQPSGFQANTQVAIQSSAQSLPLPVQSSVSFSSVSTPGSLPMSPIEAVLELGILPPQQDQSVVVMTSADSISDTSTWTAPPMELSNEISIEIGTLPSQLTSTEQQIDPSMSVNSCNIPLISSSSSSSTAAMIDIPMLASFTEPAIQNVVTMHTYIKTEVVEDDKIPLVPTLENYHTSILPISENYETPSTVSSTVCSENNEISIKLEENSM